MEASVEREGSTSPAPDRKATVEALIKGARDSATLLSSLLQDHAPGSPTRVLAEEIMSSMSRALLVLDGYEIPAVPRTSNPSQPFSDERQYEVSAGKKKITPVRRVYKSRSHPYSFTRIITKTINDAYTWRKYGQKEINNAKFPRSYYRCTYKSNRGCQATRQVQQFEEDPTMFEITYVGEHTCRSDPNKASTSESYLISFGSDTTVPMMSAPLPIPKLDSDEEAVSSASPLYSSLSEELGLSEIMVTEAAAPFPTLPFLSQMSFDFRHDYLELDFMNNNEFIPLDDLLNFDNNDFS